MACSLTTGSSIRAWRLDSDGTLTGTEGFVLTRPLQGGSFAGIRELADQEIDGRHFLIAANSNAHSVTTLEIGGGADVVPGGAGNDLMFGGLGPDMFEIGGIFGADRITDFAPGVDRIHLSGMKPDFDWSQLQALLS